MDMHQKNYSKLNAQINHFLKRLKSRYDISFNEEEKNFEIAKIISQIQSMRRETFVRKQSNRVSIHDILIKDKVVRIAYDKVRNVPITALEPHWKGKDYWNFE
jgi:ribosomal protein L2